MLFYSVNSHRKIAHFSKCKCLARIPKKQIRRFKTQAQARDAGYRACGCCHPVRTYFRKRSNTQALIDYCAKKRLACEISQDQTEIDIRSSKSQWKIVATEDGKSALFHKNNHPPKPGTKTIVTGYHMQSIGYPDLVKYCEGIVEHDRYWLDQIEIQHQKKLRKTHPRKGSKKWKSKQLREKKRERKIAIRKVYHLFDVLEAQRTAK